MKKTLRNLKNIALVGALAMVPVGFSESAPIPEYNSSNGSAPATEYESASTGNGCSFKEFGEEYSFDNRIAARIVAGDFDNDGDLDIALVTQRGSSDTTKLIVCENRIPQKR